MVYDGWRPPNTGPDPRNGEAPGPLYVPPPPASRAGGSRQSLVPSDPTERQCRGGDDGALRTADAFAPTARCRRDRAGDRGADDLGDLGRSRTAEAPRGRRFGRVVRREVST